MDEIKLQKLISDYKTSHPQVKNKTDQEIISIMCNDPKVKKEDVAQLSTLLANPTQQSGDSCNFSTKTTTNAQTQSVIVKTKDGKNYNLNKTIELRLNNISTELDNAEKTNGFIGKAWSGFKNLTEIGDSSDDVRQLLEKEQKLLDAFNSNTQKRPQIFKELTGVDYTPENMEKFIKGEIKLQSKIALDKYKEGQKMAVDVTSDIVSGVVAYGTAAVCVAGGIAAAPFTAGASLGAVAVGVGIAAGAGAVTKVGLKAADANSGGREYTWNEVGKDAVIGGVSGALAPLTMGVGGAVANTTAKVAPRFIANTARYSVEGAMFGAADGGTRAALEGESIEDIAVAAGEGALVGAVAGNVMGHGANAVGKIYNTTFQSVKDNGYRYIRLFNTSKKFKVTFAPDKWQKIKLNDNSYSAKSLKNANPENLYNELKKCKYSTWELKILLKKNPNLDRTIGSLPNNCGIECSKEMTFGVDQILSKYAKQYHVSNELPKDFCKQIEKELSNILGTDVKVKFLGMGKVGKTYTITINNKKYVYKMYHDKPIQAGISETNGHGNYPELLNGIRANEDDAGHFAKLYMGRFGENNDGYLLTEFIEGVEKTTSTEKIMFKDFTNSMSTDDYGSDNVVNGVILDFGASGSTSFGKMSKEVQTLTKKVFELLDNNSTEELKSLVLLNKNNSEYAEMINYLEYLKQTNFDSYPQLFAERKDLFKVLNIDYKPDIRTIIDKHRHGIISYFDTKEYQDFLKYYGLTKSQWNKLIMSYLN